MKKSPLKMEKSFRQKRKQQSFAQIPAMRRLIARQKNLLLSLAGIGSSGFSDISASHDTYLHEARR